MDPDVTKIESGNIIERYKNRPKQLQNWCLADYASKLIIVYPSNNLDNCQDEDDYEDDPAYSMVDIEQEIPSNSIAEIN